MLTCRTTLIVPVIDFDPANPSNLDKLELNLGTSQRTHLPSLMSFSDPWRNNGPWRDYKRFEENPNIKCVIKLGFTDDPPLAYFTAEGEPDEGKPADHVVVGIGTNVLMPGEFSRITAAWMDTKAENERLQLRMTPERIFQGRLASGMSEISLTDCMNAHAFNTARWAMFDYMDKHLIDYRNYTREMLGNPDTASGELHMQALKAMRRYPLLVSIDNVNSLASKIVYRLG